MSRFDLRCDRTGSRLKHKVGHFGLRQAYGRDRMLRAAQFISKEKKGHKPCAPFKFAQFESGASPD
jgi:hypothetical protein